MTYLTIALPEAMKGYVDLQALSGMYSNADEFLAALIEREQEHQAKQKVNDIYGSGIFRKNGSMLIELRF